MGTECSKRVDKRMRLLETYTGIRCLWDTDRGCLDYWRLDRSLSLVERLQRGGEVRLWHIQAAYPTTRMGTKDTGRSWPESSISLCPGEVQERAEWRHRIVETNNVRSGNLEQDDGGTGQNMGTLLKAIRRDFDEPIDEWAYWATKLMDWKPDATFLDLFRLMFFIKHGRLHPVLEKGHETT